MAGLLRMRTSTVSLLPCWHLIVSHVHLGVLVCSVLDNAEYN